jgi:hypothetical protein
MAWSDHFGTPRTVERAVMKAGPDHPLFRFLPLVRRRRLQQAVLVDKAFGGLMEIVVRSRCHPAFPGRRELQLFAGPCRVPMLEPHTFHKVGWSQWSYERVVDAVAIEPGEFVRAPSKLEGVVL